jgi:hypothetical protein
VGFFLIPANIASVKLQGFMEAFGTAENLRHRDLGFHQGPVASVAAKMALVIDVVVVGYFHVKFGKGNVAMLAKPGLVFTMHFQKFIDHCKLFHYSGAYSDEI